jgi:hypothetical protein
MRRHTISACAVPVATGYRKRGDVAQRITDMEYGRRIEYSFTIISITATGGISILLWHKK